MKCGTKAFALILGLLLAARLVIMATTPVFEPSEARYAAIAANMARTGDFLVPRFTYKGEYQSFDGKPPLLFQAGGRAAQLLGVNEFAVRLFPLLSAVLLGVILYHGVKRLRNAQAARTAVILCMTSVAIYASAGFCMMDMPLTCCVAGAVILYAVYQKEGKLRDLLVASALLGCGMLVKGPVALALFGMPVVAQAAALALFGKPMAVQAVAVRRLQLPRWWHCLLGAALFLAIAAPWFVMMQRANPGFLRYFFVNENLLRFLVHEYGDKYGAGRETFRGMAAIWLLVSTLPWSLLPVLDLVRRPPRTWWRWLRHTRWTLSAWAVLTTTLFWCLTSRVPIAYLFPAVPLFAAACALGRRARIWAQVSTRGFAAAAVLAVVVLVGVLGYTRLFTNKLPGESAPPRVSSKYFSYEFYHGPWGMSNIKRESEKGR